MNTVVLILYAQLSQHSEMCFLWSRGALCRQLYSKDTILDFLCVAVFASESQLWFQGTIIMFPVIWETWRQGDMSFIYTTSQFIFGMSYVCGSVLKSAFALLLLSDKLLHFATAQCQQCDCSWDVSRWNLVFKTDKDCKNWKSLSGSFLPFSCLINLIKCIDFYI